MRAYVTLFVLAAVVAVGLWRVLRRGPTNPEEQVRRTIAEAVKETEARDLGGLIGHVSERFKGQGMDRRELKGFLFVQLRRGAWRRVFLADTQVSIAASQRSARVTTGAVLASGDNLKSLAEAAQTEAGSYKFDITMELEDGAWHVVAASYEETPLSSLLPMR